MGKRKKLLSWQVAFIYIGAIIGAGFASGQEILKFFCIYGIEGIIGTLLAGVLFALLGGMIISTASQQGMENYEMYLNYLFGNRRAKIFDVIIMIFLFSGLTVMLIASGNLFAQVWGFTAREGFIITALIIYLALLTGLEGLLWLNTALVPGLILFCLVIAGLGIYLSDQGLVVINPGEDLPGVNWLLASVLYVGYNLVLGTVMLSSLGNKVKAGGVKGAMLGGLLLGAMAALMGLALLSQGEQVTGNDIPMLALAYKLHPLLGWLYYFVLWSAILTTALGNGFGLLKRLEGRNSLPKPLLVLILFIPTVPFTGWPLARAVETIYPLLGYIGLVFIVAIIKKAMTAVKLMP